MNLMSKIRKTQGNMNHCIMGSKFEIGSKDDETTKDLHVFLC